MQATVEKWVVGANASLTQLLFRNGGPVLYFRNTSPRNGASQGKVLPRWMLRNPITQVNNKLVGGGTLGHYPMQSSSASFYSTEVRRCSSIPPNNRSTALILFEDLKELKASPRAALTLAFGGLIPFLLPPVYFIVTQSVLEGLVQAQTLYGAVILSFLGGMQWGHVVLRGTPAQMSCSSLSKNTLPAVVAWVGLLLPVATASILCLMAGHSYMLYSQLSELAFPSWFRALRFVFVLTVIITLWTTLVCLYSIKPVTRDENPKTGT